MKIVIAGAGSVGRYMAQELSEQGNSLTVIDVKKSSIEKMNAQTLNITTHWGDACDLSVLTRAALAEADVVAAVTGDDEDNLVISLLAKQEFGVPRVVARVNNPNNQWMFNEMWGVDVSVSTPHLLTALVEEAVTTGSLVQLLSLDRGKASLEEVVLTSTSRAVGMQISDLTLPRESTVVGIIRDHHVIPPSGNTVLYANDEVLILMTGKDSKDLVTNALIGAS